MITIIIPAFNEEIHIQNNVTSIIEILESNNIDYEILLIDDGSKDRTWHEIKILCSQYSSINAIRLSRNFGKEAALFAGIDFVKTDACIFIDADLQHPPNLIPEMVRLWEKEGFDVVEAIKVYRGNESFFNKFSAILFYKTMKKFSGFNLDKASDFKLIDAKVIKSLKQCRERNTFFRGLSEWVGFKKIKIPFEVDRRSGGKTKWSFVSLTRLAITALTSFSSVPLHIVSFLGFILFLCSILMGIQTLYMKFSGIAVTGFTTVILLLLIIGSTLMISLGIIGAYIAKIFDEVKFRPRYLISQTISKNDKSIT